MLSRGQKSPLHHPSVTTCGGLMEGGLTISTCGLFNGQHQEVLQALPTTNRRRAAIRRMKSPFLCGGIIRRQHPSGQAPGSKDSPLKHRGHPDDVHAELLKVVHLADNPGDVSQSVPVAILEAGRIDLAVVGLGRPSGQPSFIHTSRIETKNNEMRRASWLPCLKIQARPLQEGKLTKRRPPSTTVWGPWPYCFEAPSCQSLNT